MSLGTIHHNSFKVSGYRLKFILLLSIFAISLYGLSSTALATIGPFFFNNATNITATTEYDSDGYYIFQVNITNGTVGGTAAVSNGTIFQLGRPDGTFQNLTRLTSPAVTNNTIGLWWINLTQNQLGPAGTYNYTWYANNTANVFNASNFSASPGNNRNGDAVVVINRNSKSFVTLSINGTRDNKTIDLASGGTINVTVQSNATDNITAGAGLDGLHMFTNFTGSNISVSVSNMSANSAVFNETGIFTLWRNQSCTKKCIFTISANHTQSQNYTVEENNTIFLTIQDTTAPSIGSFVLKEPSKVIYVGSSLTAADFTCSATDVDSQSTEITGLDTSNPVTKTATCKVTDPSSNAATNTLDYTVYAVSGSPPPSTPSATSAPTTPTEKGKASAFIQSIAANGVATVTVSKETETNINEIKIGVVNQASGVSINIVKLTEKPAEVTTALGTVFSYVNIVVNIPQTNLKNATVKFHVTKAWIQQNNIDVNKVTLNRYANNQWNALETSKVSEDNEFIYYSALTPGFSVFSITGDQKAVAAPVQPTPPSTPAPIPPPPVPPQAPTPEVPTAPAPRTGLVVTFVIIALVVTAVIFYLQKMKKPLGRFKKKI